MQEFGCLIDGAWVAPNGTRDVISPYTGEPVFRVATAGVPPRNSSTCCCHPDNVLIFFEKTINIIII